MTNEARNDDKARKIIALLYDEGVTAENITRLLNYHFEDAAYLCERDAHYKATIRRVPQGANYAPPVIVWKQ